MTQAYDPLAAVQAAGPPGTISFVYGLPDPTTFPAEELRQAADEVFRTRAPIALQYGPEQGYGPLIDYLIAKIAGDEGLQLERPQIMLTSGSAAALDLVCTLFTRPGDRVLVEAPTYHESLQLMRDHGLVPHQVTMDADGLQPEAMARVLHGLARQGDRARLLYTIPSFQNPSGITLASGRRMEVLRLAAEYDLLLVEDDVYRDLAYEGPPPPSFCAIDRGKRVLRIGSFSKILAPGVRMGWLIAPPELLARLIGCGLLNMGGGANPLMANILATYCRLGLLEPHIELLRTVYRERRDRALGALAAHMPEGVRWTRPGGGFFLWISLPGHLRSPDVAALARQAGLWIPSGDPFFAEEPTGQCLRLAFSYVAPERIAQGIEKLAEIIRGI